MIEIENIASSGALYGHPFVSPVRDPDHVKLDVSTLTAAEVDAYGYIKPGVPLQQNGALVSAAGQTVHGIVIEAEKLPHRRDNANLATDSSDPLIAVCTSGLIKPRHRRGQPGPRFFGQRNCRFGSGRLQADHDLRG